MQEHKMFDWEYKMQDRKDKIFDGKQKIFDQLTNMKDAEEIIDNILTDNEKDFLENNFGKINE